MYTWYVIILIFGCNLLGMEDTFVYFPSIPNDIVAHCIPYIPEEKSTVAFALTNKNNLNILNTYYPKCLPHFQCKTRKLRMLNALKTHWSHYLHENPGTFFDPYIDIVTNNKDTKQYMRHHVQNRVHPIAFNTSGNQCALFLPAKYSSSKHKPDNKLFLLNAYRNPLGNIFCNKYNTQNYWWADNDYPQMINFNTHDDISIYTYNLFAAENIKTMYKHTVLKETNTMSESTFCTIEKESVLLSLSHLCEYPLLLKKIINTEPKNVSLYSIYQLSAIRSHKQPLHEVERMFITNIVTHKNHSAYATKNSLLQWALFCYKYGNVTEMITVFSAIYNHTKKLISTYDLTEIASNKQLQSIYKQCSFDNVEPLKKYMDMAYTKIMAEPACENS